MTGPLSPTKLFDCPALTALNAVSGKWKTRILWLLRERPHHFNELKRTLPGVSAKVLSQQIQQLEDDGLIERQETVRNGVKHVDYTYSTYGRTLIPALDALGDWGLGHADRQSTPK